jgi:hypothetical protein
MSLDVMKQALAVLEDYEPNEAHKVAVALRAAIEQAEKQVPVENILGNMFEACGIGIGFGDAKLESSNVTHIYSTGVPMAKPDAIQYDKDGNEMAHWRFKQALPKQKPVAFRNTETGDFCTGGFLRRDWAKWQPLYTAPRQWVGLTDEEIDKLRHLYDGTAGWTIERFARAIEAKLKEKNK